MERRQFIAMLAGGALTAATTGAVFAQGAERRRTRGPVGASRRSESFAWAEASPRGLSVPPQGGPARRSGEGG